MATTTNYSWSTPDDTALVKDGAAAIRSLGTAIDTTVFTNAGAAIAKTIVDAKGDIIAATAADTVARLAVGANDTVLTADSSTATGLKWGTVSSGKFALIQRSSFSNVAGTGTTFDGTFSSTYVTYLICIEKISSATSTDDLQFVLRYSGTDETNHYGNLLQNPYANNTWTNIQSNNVGQITINNEQIAAYPFVGQINVSNIGTSTLPSIFGMGNEQTNTRLSIYYGSTTNARTYTGFRLKSASTNITGTVAVYGLAIS